MSRQPDKETLKREGDILSKLNDECQALLRAAQTDPGAPFEGAVLAMLRALRQGDPANWLRMRAMLKTVDGVMIGELDRMTAPALGRGNGDGKQGQSLEWEDPEPWPGPVDGAALLDEIKGLLEHYAALPEGGSRAIALWALYSWVFDAFSVCPNLMVTAPERGSGKTQVSELLSWMVPRPKPVSDASAAAIIRSIERDRPTLLFDEAQSFLKRKTDDPTRGILLAGFTLRFASVERCAGDLNEPRRYSTFAPKAMNGINLAGVDDKLTSRSIVIPMMRATKSLPELRADRDPVGEDVRSRCARWADDNRAALREADPDMRGRIGREAQPWRPLFAVADMAGGDWPKQIREAADNLAAKAATFADSKTLGVMLLEDVRTVFGSRDRIKSKDLDAALIELPERPWKTYGRGDKPLTPAARGRILAVYGIRSETLRFPDNTDSKGYKRTDLETAWASYLSEPGADQPVDPLTSCKTRHFEDSRPVDDTSSVNGSDALGNPTKQGGSMGQRVGAEVKEERELKTDALPVPLLSQPPLKSAAAEAYQRAKDGE